MHPVPRHRIQTPPIVPIDEPQPLVPYPDRLTSLGGVRQHTPPEPHIEWMVIAGPDLDDPSSFGEDLPPLPSSWSRPRRLPWLSAGLYAVGQVILALAIALGQISPVSAIGVCVLWMICGLCLIAAQYRTENS